VSQERIKIVGAGLIGTSLGLALSKHGVDVGLENRSKANSASQLSTEQALRQMANTTW